MKHGRQQGLLKIISCRTIRALDGVGRFGPRVTRAKLKAPMGLLFFWAGAIIAAGVGRAFGPFFVGGGAWIRHYMTVSSPSLSRYCRAWVSSSWKWSSRRGPVVAQIGRA